MHIRSCLTFVFMVPENMFVRVIILSQLKNPWEICVWETWEKHALVLSKWNQFTSQTTQVHQYQKTYTENVTNYSKKCEELWNGTEYALLGEAGMDLKVKKNNPNLHSMIKATGPFLQTMQFATVYNKIPSVFHTHVWYRHNHTVGADKYISLLACFVGNFKFASNTIQGVTLTICYLTTF